MQKEIIEQYHVSPNINPAEEVRHIVDFLKSYAKRYPFVTGFVLGISGGQDSTLAGKLAQMAVDELNEEGEKQYAFIALRLPYGKQFDEEDCQLALEYIQPTETITIDVKPAVDASVQTLKEAGIEVSDFVKGNEKARERMKVQYSIAAMRGAVVLGSDHAAEGITGFFTKYGDGGADLMPLFNLNKRQGAQILKHLECPPVLYHKIPTADLEEDRPAQPDEEALGVTYAEIDDYLEGKEVSTKARQRIEQLYEQSMHKRHLPITRFDTFWK